MISWTDLLAKNNSDDNLIRYSKGNASPVIVWNVTSVCNLNCQHCYFNAGQISNTQELTNKEAKDFIKDLAKLKVPVLLFSGGEPLLRKDIFDLAKFANERGVKSALSTNGTLITKNIVKLIKQAGISYVGISLDGLKKTNDWFRKNNGAFEQTLNGIRNCRDIGLKVGLRFTLTKLNFLELSEVFDLIEKEKIHRLCIYHLVYSGRAKTLKNQDLSHEEKREVLEVIWKKTLSFIEKGLNIEVLTVDNHADGIWIFLKLKKTNPLQANLVLKLLKSQGGNGSGRKIACVDNCGRVFPDQFWQNRCLGNVRQNTFSQIWQDGNNDFLRILRNRASFLTGRCQRCYYLSLCNGNFRARAEAVFGSPWADDPACYLTEEEIRGQ